jgi:hypothetical protein
MDMSSVKGLGYRAIRRPEEQCSTIAIDSSLLLETCATAVSENVL